MIIATRTPKGKERVKYLEERTELLGIGDSHLSSQLLRRQRSGGLRFKASLGKWFKRPYLKNPITKKSWWSSSRCRP
jgi:hypothetical protein